MISAPRVRLAIPLAIAAALALASCQKPAPPPAEGPKPVASIQELMEQQVDPTADVVWGAVSEKIDASGYHKKVPQTDQEWADLRQAALRLAELPNLLTVPGRAVALRGGKVADEGSPGVLTTAQIQAQIEKNPGLLKVAAARLQGSALEMVAAIDARDPDRLAEAGEHVDAACESCHLQFWYPPGDKPKDAAKVYSGPKK